MTTIVTTKGRKFTVKEHTPGKFAITIADPSGVVAVLIPVDESQTSAEELAEHLEAKFKGVVTKL